MQVNKNNIHSKIIIAVIGALLFGISCDEDTSSLAPYVGSPGMSTISLESGSFNPRITWVGGYVTVLGVNQGNFPALDSTLIWLIYQPGDQVRYPVKYGDLPSGAQDITTNYGGEFVSTLIEDSTYSFWVMKEEDWNQVSSNHNKYLSLDSTISSIVIEGDTVRLPPQNYTEIILPFDNYINIEAVTPRGRLGVLDVVQPTTDNNPIISWEIIQSGVTDTLISVIGIAASNQFDPDALIWEVYSEHDSAGITYYGRKNVIAGPLKTGDNLDETFVFTEYPEGGLERDKTYYLYIANEYWNGESHGRAANYYCYVTFKTF